MYFGSFIVFQIIFFFVTLSSTLQFGIGVLLGFLGFFGVSKPQENPYVNNRESSNVF